MINRRNSIYLNEFLSPNPEPKNTRNSKLNRFVKLQNIVINRLDLFRSQNYTSKEEIVELEKKRRASWTGGNEGFEYLVMNVRSLIHEHDVKELKKQIKLGLIKEPTNQMKTYQYNMKDNSLYPQKLGMIGRNHGFSKSGRATLRKQNSSNFSHDANFISTPKKVNLKKRSSLFFANERKFSKENIPLPLQQQEEDNSKRKVFQPTQQILIENISNQSMDGKSEDSNESVSPQQSKIKDSKTVSLKDNHSSPEQPQKEPAKTARNFYPKYNNEDAAHFLVNQLKKT